MRTKTHNRHLNKFISWLENLEPEKFDFKYEVSEAEVNGHICPTVCCAIGWTPTIFPRTVKMLITKNPNPEADQKFSFLGFKLPISFPPFSNYHSYSDVAEYLFGIPKRVASDLFYPNSQHFVGLPDLDTSATPQQVAAMLREYKAKTK